MTPDEEIVEWIRDHPDPVVSSAEVADEFGLSTRGMGKRLASMEEAGKVASKDIGPAKCWWIPDD